MGRYLIRRTLFMVLVLFDHLAAHVPHLREASGRGPCAPRGRRRAGTPERIEAARKAFGLNKPLYVQYGGSPRGSSRGPGLFLDEDVYYSYANFVPVKEEI